MVAHFYMFSENVDYVMLYRLASVHLIYIITFIIIFNYGKKSSSKNTILSDSQISWTWELAWAVI